MKITVPILNYHKIDRPPAESRNPNLYVTPENFARQMRYLHLRGYQALSLAEVGRALASGSQLPRKSVVITFDDGFRDNYEHAFPVLQRYGLSATIFSVTDFIGQRAAWKRSRETLQEPMLSWSQMREMQKSGMVFGAHTCTHPRLSRIPLEQARQEILTSRKKLEDGLGAAAESFCYPYGDYNADVVNLVREAGYAAACITEHGNCHAPGDVHTLRRVFIWLDTPVWRFAYYLTGLYDYEKARKRRRKAERKGKTGIRD